MIKNMDAVYSLYKKLQNYRASTFKITATEYAESQNLGLGIKRIGYNDSAFPISTDTLNNSIAKLDQAIKESSIAVNESLSNRRNPEIPPHIIRNIEEYLLITKDSGNEFSS
ncbi:hypothetical protein L3V82_04255 [Thiotrichales bacterium 19S3-7]|nr:hypothetical protein [Thiotrichales bacterium 19S3-7]MCF6802684.1 hypothetical protein [Thiotrichales bacterium 19S3-11]